MRLDSWSKLKEGKEMPLPPEPAPDLGMVFEGEALFARAWSWGCRARWSSSSDICSWRFKPCIIIILNCAWNPKIIHQRLTFISSSFWKSPGSVSFRSFAQLSTNAWGGWCGDITTWNKYEIAHHTARCTIDLLQFAFQRNHLQNHFSFRHSFYDYFRITKKYIILYENYTYINLRKPPFKPCWCFSHYRRTKWGQILQNCFQRMCVEQ